MYLGCHQLSALTGRRIKFISWKFHLHSKSYNLFEAWSALYVLIPHWRDLNQTQSEDCSIGCPVARVRWLVSCHVELKSLTLHCVTFAYQEYLTWFKNLRMFRMLNTIVSWHRRGDFYNITFPATSWCGHTLLPSSCLVNSQSQRGERVLFWTELFHLNVSSISSDTYLSYTIHTNAAAPSPSHSGLLTSTEWNFYVRFVLFLASPPTPNGKIKLRNLILWI